MSSGIPRLGELFSNHGTRQYNPNAPVIQVLEEQHEENFNIDYEEDGEANLDLLVSNIKLNQTMVGGP